MLHATAGHFTRAEDGTQGRVMIELASADIT